ncbi:peptide chain release factor 1 [Candidatus Photodesmus blepharus]|uniref:Peptide chain release factor 1 n=1 Tax=Candidatus Photodesmus blepharonis TaxID=1179155 RepID=A0A084CPC5_9GAMM|nr:peptide chain release factor 1 [Candidatus Photodesmus blepharus]KEY91654.1 peptide chain release factor 1 [Candidatus Photodesmus blepharus]
MKASILTKLEMLLERYKEIQYLLSDPSVISNQNRFRILSKEYSRLEEISRCFQEYQQAQENFSSLQEMENREDDVEIREMVKEEIKKTKVLIQRLSSQLHILLLPKDPNDKYNCFLEIRAGSGGDESGIFAGNLFRMYSKFSERKGWRVEVINCSESEKGGYKEVIAKISGYRVYGTMKFESGGHRVQRIPETESQGRIHTSACTVAIMPEIPVEDFPEIKTGDLKIDTFRASGAGGQHVNTTDSAIRVTHLPTGIVVECQDERSQHKNKAKAMSVLAARMIRMEEVKRAEEVSNTRRNLLGSGDRSDRIRTYNYPQGRVSDHRINLTLYRLIEVMEGDLEILIEPVIQEHQAERLSLLSDSKIG